MKLLPYILASLLTGSLLSSCSTRPDGSPTNIRHVIVIGIDGLSAAGFKKASTPIMDSMAAEGSLTTLAHTVLPTVSSPNWASIIMGAGPEQHGTLGNEWEANDHTMAPVVHDREGRFPTIFSIIHEQLPEAEIGAVYQWEGFGRLFQKKAVNYDRNFPTPEATAADFADYIRRKKPVFAFMHLDHVDGAGHDSGHGTEAYYRAITRADSLIGLVWRAVKKAGLADETLIMITADHGGVGYGHGGHSPEELYVPFLSWGKGVKKGYTVRQQVYPYDVAATAAYALGIVPPYVWIGRPVKAAFEGQTEPKNLWLGEEDIEGPVIYPERVLFQQAGGLYIDRSATVNISAPDSATSIHYTLDGSEPTSRSPKYSRPFTLTQSAVVKAKTFDRAGRQSLSSIAYFRIVKTGGNNGLHVRFYPGEEWKYLPPFDRLKPKSEWNAYEFSINRQQILSLLPANDRGFGLMFDGFLQIDQAGEYKFYTQSDDGSKLYIDGKEVVDNDGNHGVIESTGTIPLSAGKHAIRVTYINGSGGFWLDAFYRGPGVAKQLIPADKLFLTK